MQSIKYLILLIAISFHSHLYAALSIPKLNLPADKSTNIETSARLRLDGVSGAKYYEFEISKNPDMSDSVRYRSYYQSTFTGYTYSIALYLNTKYYWRARALSDKDSSPWTGLWSFTTDTFLTSITPYDNAKQNPMSYFSCDRTGDFHTYVFEIDTSSSFNSDMYIYERVKDTFSWFYFEHRQKGIRFHTKYYFRIKGVGDKDSSHWSRTGVFSTNDTVRIYSPPDGVNSMSTNAVIDWYRDAYINYQIEYDTSIDFKTPKRELKNITKNDQYKYSLKELDFDQTYYWRLRGCAETDTSFWTYPRKFITKGLVNSYPINNLGTNLAPQFAVTWGRADSATHYECQMDTLADFSSNFRMDTLFEYDYSKSFSQMTSAYIQMPFGTTFYFRERPKHARDTGGWSRVRTANTAARVTAYFPSQNAINIPVKVDLKWLGFVGVTGYRVQRDISPLFNSPELTDTLNISSLSTMKYNTTYYWRVLMMHEKDTSDWSVTKSFTTISKPVLKAPYNTRSFGPGVAGVFEWDTISGTTKYQIALDTTAGFNSDALILETTQNDTNKINLKNFYFGKVYYWKVRAITNEDTSLWSDVWNFYTYNPVRLSLPKNKSTGITFTSLDWNSINGTTGYHYILSTDSALDQRWEGYELKDNSFFHYFSPDPTNFNTQYWWKVRVFHDKDTSGWSEIWTFTTRPRKGVVINYPADKATNIPLGVLTSWQAVTDATQYSVEYSEDSAMAGLINKIVYVPALEIELKPNTKYYWRVQARNKDGVSLTDYSEVHSFTSAAFIEPPILLAPANKVTNVNSSAALTWSIVRTARYDVQLSLDSLFTAPQINGTSSKTITYNNLKTNTNYYWRVRSRNQYNTGPWSDFFTFRTAIGAGIVNPDQEFLTIFPNPSTDRLTVRTIKGEPLNTLEVFDLKGRMVKGIYNLADPEVQIDLSGIQRGIYWLKSVSNSNTSHQKILLE
ncbi:MAG: T9SS type A sorting domain-containing protein [Flavobacteriales bacterium]|nr:T9SS type A sorting domain-containing protein [Flavobacteriales bacterium]